MTQPAITTLHAGSALTPEGWRRDARISLAEGRIVSIEHGIAAEAGDERHAVLVAAIPNLHSHAFQRAMAGLAEVRGPGEDSFWSWRTTMYRFALAMTPEHLEAVAAQLYIEMLEAGFGRVGEFHYLHHGQSGRPYANIAELAERIAAASRDAGISLTLLPVFYAHSGFGGGAPADGQRRFINSLDQYEALMENCRTLLARLPGARLGVAPHSLRAVTPDELARIVPLADGGPVHIHVAEQVKEVEDCVAWSGARPVEWLLANAPVDEHWCLIHATHMSETEVSAMARRKAIGGLCPLTEANLGDGVFNAPLFLSEGGRFGIGSDSNIRISVADELCQLEYSQRLHLKARNVIAEPSGSTARRLFDGAIEGGGGALGAPAGLMVGGSADLVSLDVSAAPYLANDQILDHWLFAGGVRPDCVWVGGVKLVEDGRHVRRTAINKRFKATMQQLLEAAS